MKELSFTVRSNVEIMRPVEDVFSYVADGFFVNRAKQSPRIKESVQTSLGPISVSTTGREVSADSNGYLTETLFTVTAFERDRLFALESSSRFMDKLSDDRDIPARYKALLSKGTTSSTRCEFIPNGPTTNFTVWSRHTTQSSFWSRIIYPLWIGSYREASFKSAYRLRDILEQQAGLPARRRPFRIRRAW